MCILIQGGEESARQLFEVYILFVKGRGDAGVISMSADEKPLEIKAGPTSAITALISMIYRTVRSTWKLLEAATASIFPPAHTYLRGVSPVTIVSLVLKSR